MPDINNIIKFTRLIKPAGDQEKSSMAYCSNKNHNFANIGHKNMNDAKCILTLKGCFIIIKL